LDLHFPTTKYLARKKEVTNFKQQEGKILHDTWERFKLLLKRCSRHKYSNMDKILYFTSGLQAPTRMLADTSVGETIKTKTTEEVRELIENMAHNDYQPTFKEVTSQKVK
jgi:hypothetical protein